VTFASPDASGVLAESSEIDQVDSFKAKHLRKAAIMTRSGGLSKLIFLIFITMTINSKCHFICTTSWLSNKLLLELSYTK